MISHGDLEKPNWCAKGKTFQLMVQIISSSLKCHSMEYVTCTGSCFGASTLTRGFVRQCGGEGERHNELIDCGWFSNQPRPDNNAGVICSKHHGDTLLDILLPACPTCSTQTDTPPSDDITPCPPSTTIQPPDDCSQCPTPSLPASEVTTSCPTPTTPPCNCSRATPITSPGGRGQATVEMGSDFLADRTDSGERESQHDLAKGESCTAIGAALGAISAILLLTLVGVVTGWAWSCHRNKGPKAKIR